MTNLYHHELLDRLWLIMEMYNDFICEHPSNDILPAEEKDKVRQMLFDQYQLVGAKSSEIEESNIQSKIKPIQRIEVKLDLDDEEDEDVKPDPIQIKAFEEWLQNNMDKYIGTFGGAFCDDFREHFKIEYRIILTLNKYPQTIEFLLDGVGYQILLYTKE